MRRLLLFLTAMLLALAVVTPADAKWRTESVWTMLRHYSHYSGVPYPVLATIVLAESGGDPRIVGDYGTSFGLLQLHRGGEAGNWPPSYLFGARHNLWVGVPYLRRAYHERCAGLSGYGLVSCVAAWSGHNGLDGWSVDADLPQAWAAFKSGDLPYHSVRVPHRHPPGPPGP